MLGEFSSASTVQEKSGTSYTTEREEKYAKEVDQLNKKFVELVFEILLSPRPNGDPLSRMFTIIGVDRSRFEHLVQNIKNHEKKDTEVKNAAEILLRLYDTMNFRHNLNNSFQDFINAMSNDKLSVKYANSIYLLYHKGYYSQEHGRNFLSELAVPTLKSPAWQKTVLIVRETVLKKLEAEVQRLPENEKITFLENAKTLPIFSEHTSNFRITGAWGQTGAMNAIDGMIRKVREVQQTHAAIASTGLMLTHEIR